MATTNKDIISKVNEGFAEDDTDKILSYMADDVRWIMAGAFDLTGKEAFRMEVEKGSLSGTMSFAIKTEIAEGDFVSVEGELQCNKKDGSVFNAFFLDFYELRGGKVKEMRSYILEKDKK